MHLVSLNLFSFWGQEFVVFIISFTFVLFLQIVTGFEFSSVQLLSRVQLFETPWTAAGQASLSISNSQSLLKLMFMELVMPSNHHILCHPLLLLPSIFPSIRVFFNESVPHITWPKYWSFSINSFNEYSGLISFSKISPIKSVTDFIKR